MNCQNGYKIPKDEWEALDCLEEIEPSPQFAARVMERVRKETPSQKPFGIFDMIFGLRVPAWVALLVLVLGITAVLVFPNLSSIVPSYNTGMSQPYIPGTVTKGAAHQDDIAWAGSYEDKRYEAGLDMGGRHSFYSLIAAEETKSFDNYPEVSDANFEFSLPSGADMLLESSED